MAPNFNFPYGKLIFFLLVWVKTTMLIIKNDRKIKTMQERNVTADGCWGEDLEKTAQLVSATTILLEGHIYRT